MAIRMNPPQYMLLLRNTDWDAGLSPTEIESAIRDYTVWFEGLIEQGKVSGGYPLLNGGKLVSIKKGGVISDGPFIESKEAIGGYIVLRVDDENEAVAIAKTFPPVARGVVVEIRELTEVCPVSQRLRNKLSETNA
jgi:hypothetical protein